MEQQKPTEHHPEITYEIQGKIFLVQPQYAKENGENIKDILLKLMQENRRKTL